MQASDGNVTTRARRRAHRLKVAATAGSVVAFGAIFGVVAVRTNAHGEQSTPTPAPVAATTTATRQQPFPWAPSAPIPAPATPPRFGGSGTSQPSDDSQPPVDSQSPAASQSQAPIRIHTRTRAS